jgi:2-polyprenyl-6-hydroxyphenyl methylase / 3-demethylubiquinone-9 3-methyltransferase
MSIYCASQGADVTLVDAESTALATAHLFAQRAGVTERVRTMQSLVFPDALKGTNIDAIIAKDIIEHILDDEGLLTNFSECQRRGGRLLLSTHNSMSLNGILGSLYYRRIKGYTQWLGWDTTHVRFYTTQHIIRLLAHTGYRVTGIAGLYILPYGVGNSQKTWAKPLVNLSMCLDRCLGGIYPFNRWGWNFVVHAKKR